VEQGSGDHGLPTTDVFFQPGNLERTGNMSLGLHTTPVTQQRAIILFSTQRLLSAQCADCDHG